MSTYLYGLVGREHPQKLKDCTGIGSPPAAIRVLAAGDLIAVVGDAPEDLRAKRRDLLAHEEVLETLCAQGATLPMQFGVVGDNDDAVIQEVARDAENYTQLLADLEGRIEINVKARHHEDALLRQILLDNDDLRARNERIKQADDGGSYEERVQFGELVSQAVGQREESDSQAIVERLRRHAVRENPGPAVGDYFLNVSFLVAGTEVEEFQSAVAEVGNALDELLELRARGPLPPYSFTEIPQPEPEIAQPG